MGSTGRSRGFKSHYRWPRGGSLLRDLKAWGEHVSGLFKKVFSSRAAAGWGSCVGQGSSGCGSGSPITTRTFAVLFLFLCVFSPGDGVSVVRADVGGCSCRRFTGRRSVGGGFWGDAGTTLAPEVANWGPVNPL